MRNASLAATALFIYLSAPLNATTLSLSPPFQRTGETCTIYVDAADLVNAKGLDIEIVFDRSIIMCSTALFPRNGLPGFSEFYRAIDNESGRIEVVTLKTSPGGFTGDAHWFLALTFEPVANGTSLVRIKRSDPQGSPIMIDAGNNGVETEVDTATVMVTGHEPPQVISAVKLHQNYPNPFNPATTITFDLPMRATVSLKVYDADGVLVRTLLDGAAYEIGSWGVSWNGTNDRGRTVPSGVYLCVLEAGGKTMGRKLVILR